MPRNDEHKRSIFYLCGGVIVVTMIGLIGEIDSVDMRFLTNWFLRLDGNNSPNATISWNNHDLVNVNFLNATNIQSYNLTTVELHYVNETRANVTVSDVVISNSLTVIGTAIVHGLITTGDGLNVSKNATIWGNASIAENLNVSKNTYIGGNLSVTQNASFFDSVSILKRLIIDSMTIDGENITTPYGLNLKVSGNNTSYFRLTNEGNTTKISNIGDGDITLNATSKRVNFSDNTIVTAGNIGVGIRNPPQNLTVVGTGNVTGNFTANFFYGGMWFHNATGFSFSMGSAGSWENITAFNQTLSANRTLNGFTYSGNSSLVADVKGKYKLDYLISLQRSSGGATFRIFSFAIFVNEVLQENTMTYISTTTSTTYSVTGLSFINLNVGDKVNMRANQLAGTSTVLFFAGNLNLVRVGD